MNVLVLITGSIGLCMAYAIGLWGWGIHVRQKQLEELADLFRQDQHRFDMYFYNIAIKMTKREIAQQEAEQNGK
jgi:hypothetical protein